MRTILLSICLMAATAVNAQKHEYEVMDQITIGELTCTYIKAVSGNTGKESYNLVLSFPSNEYSIETCEISLTTQAMREQLVSELQTCVDSLRSNFKGATKTIATNQFYTLVIHDMTNRVFIADHKGRFTFINMKQAEFLIRWIKTLD